MDTLILNVERLVKGNEFLVQKGVLSFGQILVMETDLKFKTLFTA